MFKQFICFKAKVSFCKTIWWQKSLSLVFCYLFKCVTLLNVYLVPTLIYYKGHIRKPNKGGVPCRLQKIQKTLINPISLPRNQLNIYVSFPHLHSHNEIQSFSHVLIVTYAVAARPQIVLSDLKAQTSVCAAFVWRCTNSCVAPPCSATDFKTLNSSSDYPFNSSSCLVSRPPSPLSSILTWLAPFFY